MISSTGRAALLAAMALTLVLAGCGGPDKTAADSPATAAAVTSSPVASPSPSASPSPTSPPPCQRTASWSPTQTRNWVRAMTEAEAYDIVLGRDSAVATVCKGVPVQVEFWHVVLTSVAGRVSYTMNSAQRKQVAIDGRRTVTVKAPKGFEARDCGGTLTAVYLGKPLAETEMPAELDPAGSGGDDVEFNTDRVAFSVAYMPGGGDELRKCHP
jgi:hypothetical protein